MAIQISAKDVAELRKKTGCGMMECKKALVEAEGNFDEAVKVLREKGLAVAAKKADRIQQRALLIYSLKATQPLLSKLTLKQTSLQRTNPLRNS